MVVGGWSTLREITGDDKEVFEKALSEFVGVTFEPLLVETQVVSGIKYRFICNAATVTAEPVKYAAVVTVWSKSDGIVEIADIAKFNDLF